MGMMQIVAGTGPFGPFPAGWTMDGSVIAFLDKVNTYVTGDWITSTTFGSWSYTLGDGSQVTNKGKFFNPTVDDGPGGPNGNPSQIRYTFAGNGIQGYSNARVRCNTYDDVFAQRRVYFNTNAGTTGVINQRANVWNTVGGNNFNWVECGNYGGADTNRPPSGMLALEIDGYLCVDPDYATYGG